MSESSHPHTIHCARRAAERVAAILSRELGRGTTSLHAIACVASLLGMFGTAVLLMDALSTYYALACGIGDCAGGASEALVPIALSLLVAIFAWGGFYCLRHQVESLDLEMRTATLD